MLCNLSMFQFCGRASLCLCCVFISCFFFCIWSSLVSVLVCLVSFSSGLGVFLGSLCLGGPFSLLVCVFLLGFCLGGVSLVWFFCWFLWVGLGWGSTLGGCVWGCLWGVGVFFGVSLLPPVWCLWMNINSLASKIGYHVNFLGPAVATFEDKNAIFILCSAADTFDSMLSCCHTRSCISFWLSLWPAIYYCFGSKIKIKIKSNTASLGGIPAWFMSKQRIGVAYSGTL